MSNIANLLTQIAVLVNALPGNFPILSLGGKEIFDAVASVPSAKIRVTCYPPRKAGHGDYTIVSATVKVGDFRIDAAHTRPATMAERSVRIGTSKDGGTVTISEHTADQWALIHGIEPWDIPEKSVEIAASKPATLPPKSGTREIDDA